MKTLLIKLFFIVFAHAYAGSAINPGFSNISFKEFEKKEKGKEILFEEPEPEVKVFKKESGWGYNIYIGNKLYIHQPYIPAISGNHTFSSEEEARKTGELIVVKIQKEIIPPTITIMELDSLGVIIPIQSR